MIKTRSYSLNNITLTHDTTNVYVTQFWNDVFAKLNTPRHLQLLCKIHMDTQGYKTLGYLRNVNFEDKELYIEYINSRVNILTESYNVDPVSKISFTYIIKDGLAKDHLRLLQDLNDKKLNTHTFSNLKLPISMDPEAYGRILDSVAHSEFTRYFVSSNNRTYQIDISNDKTTNNVQLLGLSDIKWTDTLLKEGFQREINKMTYIFVDGEMVLRKQLLSVKPFSKTVPDSKLKTRFVTMDIETTRDSNGNLNPYLICAYGDTKKGKCFINSYGNKPNL